MAHTPGASHVRDRVVVVVDRNESVQTTRRNVLEALAGRPHDLVIDMRSVDQLSNPGLALLVGVRARQRAHQRGLTLVCGPDSGTEQALSRSGMQGGFTTARKV
ncbi:MAG: STAS domain-containing protein [Actinomycetes bacterium]